MPSLAIALVRFTSAAIEAEVGSDTALKAWSDPPVARRSPDSSLVVGPAAVPGKFNELTAIRQLFPALELEGRVVSIGALACQTDIAETLAERSGGSALSSPTLKD